MSPPSISRRASLANLAGLAIGSSSQSQASHGTGGDQRKSQLASPARNWLGTGIISLLDHMSDKQVRAIRNAQPIEGLAELINEVSSWAGKGGMTLLLPTGLYDLRKPIDLHPLCWLVSEAAASWPQQSYTPGFRYESGVVLLKNHDGDATIRVQGETPYAACGGIAGIAISADPRITSTARGDGLVIDRLGGYRILDFRAFAIPRDGLVLGTGGGDTTGQIHMNGVYINNPGRHCILNRSKWLKAAQIETDGGQYSLFAENAPNADFTQFHFEGAQVGAICLSGGSGNSRFRGGFVAMTNTKARIAVEIQSAKGNTDITLRDVQIVAHDKAEVAVEIGAAAWRTNLESCEILHAPIGVRDAGKGTRIASSFIDTGLAIWAAGNETDYRGSYCIGTRGPYCLDHRGARYSLWTDMRVDKPFKPSTTNAPGDFGGNIVARVTGFVTAFRQATASARSPMIIPHGMAVPPATAIVDAIGAPRPADLSVEFDAANITLRWSGGKPCKFSIDARAACELG